VRGGGPTSRNSGRPAGRLWGLGYTVAAMAQFLSDSNVGF
jgi:hypothetical protein